MKYQELLKNLFDENGYNPYSFSQKFGGTDVTYRNIIEGKTQSLSYKIKRRIESAFHIVIDDSDINNLSYMPKKEAKPTKTVDEKLLLFNNSNFIKEYNMKILSSVPAGLGELKDRDEEKVVTLDSRRQFGLIIDQENGDSMRPMMKPGDIVFCDTSIKPNKGDIVAARWNSNNGAVKVLGSDLNGEHLLLYSLNPSVDPIILPVKGTVIYKVIFWNSGN